MPTKTSDYYSSHSEECFELYEELHFEDVHSSWLHLLPSTKMLVCDVGAGSGRDASWFADQGHEIIAVEPATALRQKAQAGHSQPSIQWVNDRLPSLSKVYDLDLKFDLILVSAVWMHVAPTDRERAFRKLSNLLKPGGLLVVTLRHGPAAAGREMHPSSSGDLIQLAGRHALEVLADKPMEDRLGREEVTWSAVVMRMPDDGTGALPLLRHIIINDAKASTYKLALLRVLLRIADGAQGMVLDKNDDFVRLPFGLVAFYWIKAFYPLLIEGDYLQQPEGNGKPGFLTDEFKALSSLSRHDLRIGGRFNGALAEQLTVAIREVRNVIKNMPAHFTTYPGTDDQIFLVDSRPVRARNKISLDLDDLSRFGSFSIPRNIWDAMTRHACWIEPVVVAEWARLMRGYDKKAGISRGEDHYASALEWLDVEHDTSFVRDIAIRVRDKKGLYCIWSGKKLPDAFDVDHCMPFSHWPNNDLWNLLPSDRAKNIKKGNKLPSASLLGKSNERILEWWSLAYGLEGLSDRFLIEAKASLPLVKSLDSQNDAGEVIWGVQDQRLRLKINQQIQEWDG